MLSWRTDVRLYVVTARLPMSWVESRVFDVRTDYLAVGKTGPKHAVNVVCKGPGIDGSRSALFVTRYL